MRLKTANSTLFIIRNLRYALMLSSRLRCQITEDRSSSKSGGSRMQPFIETDTVSLRLDVVSSQVILQIYEGVARVAGVSEVNYGGPTDAILLLCGGLVAFGIPPLAVAWICLNCGLLQWEQRSVLEQTLINNIDKLQVLLCKLNSSSPFALNSNGVVTGFRVFRRNHVCPYILIKYAGRKPCFCMYLVTIGQRA